MANHRWDNSKSRQRMTYHGYISGKKGNCVQWQSRPPIKLWNSHCLQEISLLWWIWYFMHYIHVVLHCQTAFNTLCWPICPISPACSTPWQRVGGSIIPLRALLQVFNRFIICIEIDDTNLSYGYRFCFCFFAHFTSCRLHSLTTGRGIDYHSSDILTGIY